MRGRRRLRHGRAGPARLGRKAGCAEKRLVELIEAEDRGQDRRHEEIQNILRAIKLGVARLAIGHKPFEEGKAGDP